MDFLDIDHIIESMTNIKPNATQTKRIEDLRSQYKNIAIYLNQNSSETREMHTAIQYLETSLMWAVKSIMFTKYTVYSFED